MTGCRGDREGVTSSSSPGRHHHDEALPGVFLDTVRNYVADVRQLLSYVGQHGGDGLDAIDLSALRGWLAAMSAAGMSPATIARRASSARTFCAWCVRTGRMPGDPSARLVAPTVHNRLPTVLKQAEIAAALEAVAQRAEDGGPAHLRDHAALELLYGTGVRVSELVGLDIGDVDAQRRVIRVLGKGRKERMVPFGVPAENALGAWLHRGRPAFVTAVTGQALFLGSRGGRWNASPLRRWS